MGFLVVLGLSHEFSHGLGRQDPSCHDAPGGSELSLDAALAGLGVGRKLCRQLRAELKLEEDAGNQWEGG